MRDLTGKMERVFKKTASLCTHHGVERFVDVHNPDLVRTTQDDSAYLHESRFVAQFLKSEGSVSSGDQFSVGTATWEVGQPIGEDEISTMFHVHQVKTWT